MKKNRTEKTRRKWEKLMEKSRDEWKTKRNTLMEGLLDNNVCVFGARLTGLFRELGGRIHRIRVCGLSLIIW